jgi:ferredoxin
MAQEPGSVRVKVDVVKCVGHARCAAVAPSVYELDDSGFNQTPEKIVGPDLKADALRGARACPERVITVDELPD